MLAAGDAGTLKSSGRRMGSGLNLGGSCIHAHQAARRARKRMRRRQSS